MIHNLLQVALGGAIGASGRYLTGLVVIRLIGPGFPWATMIVNVVGSALMGCIVVLLAKFDATRFAPLLMTGLLGGFTTFSAFSLDAVTLYERGEMLAAGGYVAGSVILSILALFGAMVLMREVILP